MNRNQLKYFVAAARKPELQQGRRAILYISDSRYPADKSFWRKCSAVHYLTETPVR